MKPFCAVRQPVQLRLSWIIMLVAVVLTMLLAMLMTMLFASPKANASIASYAYYLSQSSN